MNQGFRTTQRIVVSALLLSAVAMGQGAAKKTETASTGHVRGRNIVRVFGPMAMFQWL